MPYAPWLWSCPAGTSHNVRYASVLARTTLARTAVQFDTGRVVINSVTLLPFCNTVIEASGCYCEPWSRRAGRRVGVTLVFW